MKTFILLLLIIILAELGNFSNSFTDIPDLNSQEWLDTSYVGDGKNLEQLIVKKAMVQETISKKTVIDKTGDNLSLSMIKKIIQKKTVQKGVILSQVWPWPKTYNIVYKIKDNIIYKAETQVKKDWIIILLWQALPFIFIIWLGFVAKSLKKYLIFMLSTTAAIAFAIIIGGFADLSIGTLVGMLIGGLAGKLTGELVNTLAGGGPLGGLVGGLIGISTGFLVSTLAENNLSTNIVWEYIPMYIIFCFIGYMILLYRLKIKQKKVSEQLAS